MVMEIIIGIIVLALTAGAIVSFCFFVKGLDGREIEEDMALQAFTWPIKLVASIILLATAVLILYIMKNT